MAWVDVEWSNGDIVTETKLDQMMENLTVARAEQVNEHVIHEPGIHFGVAIHVPDGATTSTVRGMLELNSLTAYTNSFSCKHMVNGPHSQTDLSLVDQTLSGAGMLVGRQYVGRLSFEVVTSGFPTTYVLWRRFTYFHTTERASGSLRWRFKVGQVVPGPSYSRPRWNIFPSGGGVRDECLMIWRHRLYATRAAVGGMP